MSLAALTYSALHQQEGTIQLFAAAKCPEMDISQLPKLCVKITIFMQGHVLIADWSVAQFVVIMNDVMNDNMAALPMPALVWVRSFIGPDF